jgi:hypothetical protein
MKSPVEKRICELRKRCLDTRGADELKMNPVVVANSLKASESVDSWQIRRGLLVRDILYHLRYEIDGLDLLVSRCVHVQEDDYSSHLKKAKKYLESYPEIPSRSASCELDIGTIMHLGIDGMRASLRGRVENEDKESGKVIRSFGYAIDGLSVMMENAAKMVAGVASSTDDERKAELKEMFESCWRLAHDPPETFRDMLQLHLFLAVAIQAAEGVCWYAPGHVDRLLYPFYEKDVKAGILDRDSAVELLACFFLSMSTAAPSGIDLPLMLGGVHREQSEMANELSELCLKALKLAERTNIVAVLCQAPESQNNLISSFMELPGAMIVNDSVVQRELAAAGVAEIDCEWYCVTEHGGVLPSGCSDPCCENVCIPLCGVLLDEIFEQVVFGSAVDTFEDFLDFYERRLRQAVDDAQVRYRESQRKSRNQGRRPLQSLFTRDCIQRARDIDDGGVCYSWLRCLFAGFANFANSLVVLAREVYGMGGDGSTPRLTMGELKDVLDADFEGFEEVRSRFLAHSKFGFGVPEADAMACRVVEMIERVCRGANLESGEAKVMPGLFVGEEVGHDVGATPDGRLAGEVLSQGCQPWTNDDGHRPDTLSLIRSGVELNPSVLPAGCMLEIGMDSGHDLAGIVTDFMEQGGTVLCLNAEP